MHFWNYIDIFLFDILLSRLRFQDERHIGIAWMAKAIPLSNGKVREFESLYQCHFINALIILIIALRTYYIRKDVIYLASNQAEAYYKAHREYKELEKSGASQSVLKLKG